MPHENLVTEIGRSSCGLPLTGSVPAGIHFGDPVVLTLKITNVLDRPYEDGFDENSHNPETFVVWLLCDGREVPLTPLGEKIQPRQTSIGGVTVSAIPARKLAPGAVHSKEIDLGQMFQIMKPGTYTAIVERGPVYSNDDPTREIEAAKTSFTLLP